MSVKVFFSWSGPTSRIFAEAFKATMIAVWDGHVEPFVSSQDIKAGTLWLDRIRQELRDSRFGIICVTRDNLTSPWLHFESGALSNAVEEKLVTPILVGVSMTEFRQHAGAIGFYNAITYETVRSPGSGSGSNTAAKLLGVLESINNAIEAQFRPSITDLSGAFTRYRGDLDKAVDIILSSLEKDARLQSDSIGSATSSTEFITPGGVPNLETSEGFEMDGWLAAYDSDALVPLLGQKLRVRMRVVHPDAGLGYITEIGPEVKGVPYVTVKFGSDGSPARIQVGSLFSATFRMSPKG